MPVFGIDLNRDNPEYTIQDFVFWMPQFKSYMDTDEGKVMFNNLYPLANEKIFYSIFGSDWKYAMSLCIGHYSYLIGANSNSPSGSTLPEVYGGGVTRGVLQSAAIGGFSKSYNLEYTTLNSEEAMFWNQSAYGQQLMALLKTKALASIAVVTSQPLTPGNVKHNAKQAKTWKWW